MGVSRMTKEQIKQKAENVYIRCFDDDLEYSGVLHALEICAEETAAEVTKELQEKINAYKEQLERNPCVVTPDWHCSDCLKENKELQEQISILLSCKNCPDNKGGYICEKEYNDKCLAQKIQYIKELKEEIAELQDTETMLKTLKDRGVIKEWYYNGTYHAS